MCSRTTIGLIVVSGEWNQAHQRRTEDSDERRERVLAEISYLLAVLDFLIIVIRQEESGSISENVTWGQRKRFADGKVSLPYGHFLGYEKGEDGLPKIVERQAIVVRLIYKLSLEGKIAPGIAKHLTTDKIPTPAGKEVWQQSTVRSILKNEKYKGDAILQKALRWISLPRKRKLMREKFHNIC